MEHLTFARCEGCGGRMALASIGVSQMDNGNLLVIADRLPATCESCGVVLHLYGDVLQTYKQPDVRLDVVRFDDIGNTVILVNGAVVRALDEDQDGQTVIEAVLNTARVLGHGTNESRHAITLSDIGIGEDDNWCLDDVEAYIAQSGEEDQ